MQMMLSILALALSAHATEVRFTPAKEVAQKTWFCQARGSLGLARICEETGASSNERAAAAHALNGCTAQGCYNCQVSCY